MHTYYAIKSINGTDIELFSLGNIDHIKTILSKLSRFQTVKKFTAVRKKLDICCKRDTHVLHNTFIHFKEIAPTPMRQEPLYIKVEKMLFTL